METNICNERNFCIENVKSPLKKTTLPYNDNPTLTLKNPTPTGKEGIAKSLNPTLELGGGVHTMKTERHINSGHPPTLNVLHTYWMGPYGITM